MRSIGFSLIALLFCTQAMATTVDDLGTLHGCWRGSYNGGVFQEYYSAPAGGMIFGTDQLFDSSGKNLGWGAITIEQKDSGIQFGYSGGGSAYELFDLIAFAKSKGGDFVAEFRNPNLNKVNNVHVTVSGGNSLTIALEGPGQGGGLVLNMTRVTGSQDCSAGN